VAFVPKVLIIDDDTTMVSLLKTLLEMDGFAVASAKDWDDVIETIRVEKPDLILMDYFLPEVDGIELMKEIRSAPDLAETRVVMTSGMDVSEECANVGANEFLLKPYTPEQLLNAIQDNLVANDS
jgi:CheY-like chemotaxis protein